MDGATPAISFPSLPLHTLLYRLLCCVRSSSLWAARRWVWRLASGAATVRPASPSSFSCYARRPFRPFVSSMRLTATLDSLTVCYPSYCDAQRSPSVHAGVAPFASPCYMLASSAILYPSCSTLDLESVCWRALVVPSQGPRLPGDTLGRP